MSDYEDYDEGQEGDWLYVEDAYDEADELAEYTCPSPVYLGEEGRYNEEYDMFEYFADLEYLSDGGYFDKTGTKQGTKRKHAGETTSNTRIKRKRSERSIANAMHKLPVLWMSHAERNAAPKTAIPTFRPGKSKTVSLLKDWRVKFQDHPGLASFPQGDFQLGGSGQYDDAGDAELEEDEDGGEEGEEEASGPSLDVTDLQQVAQRIGEENIEALQKMMEAQGLDPAVVEEVLRDMIEGKEREFDDEESGDMEPDEREGIQRVAASALSGSVTDNTARQGEDSRSGTIPVPPVTNGDAAHTAKRKSQDEDESDVEGTQSRPSTKRPKADAKKPGHKAPIPAPIGAASQEGPEVRPRRTRNGRVSSILYFQ